MFRNGLAVAALALAACAPTTPDSNPDVRGVGFGDYSDYRTYTAAPPPSRATSPEAVTLAADALRATGSAPPSVAPPAPGPTGISDEQNFAAVSDRETIASDAERLRRNTEAFVEVEPSAVPTRTGNEANVVAYALRTKHPVGTRVYRRLSLAGEARYVANCRKYTSADDAQEAFLRTGGPEKDKLHLDPDGDGYACSWDPTIFRRLAGG